MVAGPHQPKPRALARAILPLRPPHTFRAANPAPVPLRSRLCSDAIISSSPRRCVASSLSAFTLVELLVVIVIIIILVSSVLVAASSLIGSAKSSSTQAMLTVVRDAVEQFHREQKANPTIAAAKQQGRNGVIKYLDLYSYYPPDELEVFTPAGLRGSTTKRRSLAPGNGKMVPGTRGNSGYRAMKFYTKGLPEDQRFLEHRDQVAMVVAIQLFGQASADLLGGIQGRYWSAPLRRQGQQEIPAVFLDRPPSGGKQGDGKWGPGDHQVRYIVDDWGNPISYMSQRDFDESAQTRNISSNHVSWNEGASEMVRLNGGKPVIFSYGPDGEEQLTEEQMGNDAAASLIADFEDDHIVNHPLNADNIYADPTLKQKLAKGIAEEG